MKSILILIAVMAVAGCQSLPPQQCTATAMVGSQETTVAVYGVRKVANQTQYYAGNPFGWKWVSKANFISDTCSK